jgi:general secretion pathway protein N
VDYLPGRSQGSCRSALRAGRVDYLPGRSQGSCRSALRAEHAMNRWALGGALLGVVLAVVLFAPAAWVAAMVNRATAQRVQLVEPRGTVWDGEAQLVLSGGPSSTEALALPGRVSWRLRPGFGSVRMQLEADCCTREAVAMVLHPRWRSARVHLEDATSTWPAGVLAGLGAPWNTVQARGRLVLSTKGMSLEWHEGRVVVLGSAALDAVDLSSRLTTLRPLGNYRLQLTGAGPSGPPQLELQTLEGSLRLSGRGQWNGVRWGFRGQASASPEHELVLGNLLNIIGRRQGALSVIALD